MDSYFEALRGKKVAVIGVGVSNLPLAEKLLECGAEVTLHDMREKLTGRAGELEAKGAKLCLGKGYLDSIDAEVIFRSPGVRPDEPGITAAVKNGARLTSEMEAFFEVCPCPIWAVTGSDGKTTTTTILSLLLAEAGKKVHVGGNIGTPLLCSAGDMSEDDIAVLELSSFQLMTMDVSPCTSIVTNLAPNHLDKHLSMAEYEQSKKNIYLHQSASDLVVLNADNALTRAMACEAKGRVRLFSRKEKLDDGCWTDGETVFLGSEELFKVSDVLLPGVHNLENYMAACTAARQLVTPRQMRNVARTFKGVEHRMELVRTLDGVDYYNDSIASSPTRTQAGLACFDDGIVLIAGGYDKKIPFDDFGRHLCEKVKLLVLNGPTAEAIKKAAENAAAAVGRCP
ncbi:MAG: UDP-N-acetylmuramoyl-L-alanine--D-glutamate ligase, partial [Oscillospiraceae bacterium]|nr:UDP-N-acetylmuramoyl-L-alanine--D-glutamate ligase [Oscillospiraceae bacterium]